MAAHNCLSVAVLLFLLSGAAAGIPKCTVDEKQVTTSLFGTFTLKYRACNDGFIYFDTIQVAKSGPPVSIQVVIAQYQPGWQLPIRIAQQSKTEVVRGQKVWRSFTRMSAVMHPFVYLRFKTSSMTYTRSSPLLAITAFAPPAVTTFVRSGITLRVSTTVPQGSWHTKMINCFFTSYLKLRARFNLRAPRVVSLNFSPSFAPTMPSQTTNATITVGLDYIASHPLDFALVIHEAMHILQIYSKRTTTRHWVEGLADYARYKYGCNLESEWSLPRSVQKRVSFRSNSKAAASFLVWVEKSGGKPGIINALHTALQKPSYSEAFWQRETGKTLEQLWSAYTV